MITLKQWMELSRYRITEGSGYHCNIPNLFSLDSWNGDHNGWSLSVVFDPKNDQKVYIVEVCDYKNNRAYRVKDEAIDPGKQAWDDVDFIDLEIDDDFISKAQAIVSGEDYDTRVSVPLDLEDDLMFDLMKKAHEKDITLNQLVEEILWAAIFANKSNQTVDDDDRNDDEWDKLAEDHWDDLGDPIEKSNLETLKKSKKKKKSK